jgi:hypothetical protein
MKTRLHAIVVRIVLTLLLVAVVLLIAGHVT